MTYIEAWREAMRREGMSEEEIEARVAFANFKLPNTEINRQLPDREVEQRIAEFRGKLRIASMMGESGRAMLLALADAQAAKLNSGN